MKNRVFFFSCMMFLLFVGPLPAAPAATPAGDEFSALARQFVREMADKKNDAAFARFDPTMRKAMPADKIGATWDAVIQQCGALQKIGAVRPLSYLGYEIRFVTCRFEKATLNVRVVFNRGDKTVGGLFFEAATPGPETPAEKPPKGITESAVSIGAAPWTLPGTLALPEGKGPFAAVVLVHGSGPNDRDETLGACKPFRDLAWGLAQRGVAVLRYEKRTKEHGAACALALANFTVKQETIDDAVAAAALLRKDPRIDPKRVYIAGHSLGGMLVPRIAAADQGAAGFIILAGATRPLEDMILEQMNYIAKANGVDGTIAPEARHAIDEVRAQAAMVKALRPDAPLPTEKIMNAPACYWLDLRGYDPAEAAKSITRPLLVLQGGRDYQVSPQADFGRWQAALDGKPNVTMKLYLELNHLFIAGQGPSLPAEYQKPGKVAPEAIEAIAGWIKASEGK